MVTRYVEVLAPREFERAILNDTAGRLNGFFDGSVPSMVRGFEGKDKIEVLLFGIELELEKQQELKELVFNSFGGHFETMLMDPKTKRVISRRRCYAAAR